MSKLCTTTVSILAIIGTIFGVYFWIDNRYALSEELNKTNQRLDYKIKSDQLNSVQDRIWRYDDRYKKRDMDDAAVGEYRALQQQKEELNKDLNQIKK